MLECIRDMQPAGEATTTCARDELEGGLAVAILQVLSAQPMTVYAQQQLALGARDQRHFLGLIAPTRIR